MDTLIDMIRLAEVCKKQRNYTGFRVVNHCIDQEMKRRIKEDSSILDRVLVDIKRSI